MRVVTQEPRTLAVSPLPYGVITSNAQLASDSMTPDGPLFHTSELVLSQVLLLARASDQDADIG
jgi:hypothetical protein